MGQYRKGEDPAAARKKAENIILQDFITRHYKPWVITHRKSGKETVRRLESCFVGLLSKRIVEISPRLIEKWRTGRLKCGIKPATVNRDITTLKAALSKAVEWGFLQTKSLASVKPTKVDDYAKTRYLDRDEEQRLRAALITREGNLRKERLSANCWRMERRYELLPELSSEGFADHLCPMILLSMNTGIRRCELFNLDWSDVNFENRLFRVGGLTAKNGKTRYIPLNEEAMDVLQRWKHQRQETSGLVFPSRDGKSFNNVKKAWSALLNAANIKDFRWHDIRHHFASRLVMAGVDLNTVRELLGHSDIKMTLRYAHLAPEHKAAAVACLIESS